MDDHQLDNTTDLDRFLDAALAKYSAVEPRSGLEERILAHVHTRQAEIATRVWWPWGLAGALAVIVIVAALGWRLTRVSTRAIANHPPTAIQYPSTQKANPAPHAGEDTVARRPRERRLAQRRRPAVTAAAAKPKLEQFPSPSPLSAEEIALSRYARNFPQEAQLVAQAQRDFELETEKEMNHSGSETGPSSSTQQER